MENGADSLFHIDFSEGQRADGYAALSEAAGQQGFRVLLFPVRFIISDDLLIAGQFQVTAEQRIGGPAERVEPIDCQQKIAQYFPQMVQAFQMGLLMGDYRGVHFFRHGGGQVNAGADQAQKEWGINEFAKVYGILKTNSRPKFYDKTYVSLQSFASFVLLMGSCSHRIRQKRYSLSKIFGVAMEVSFRDKSLILF